MGLLPYVFWGSWFPLKQLSTSKTLQASFRWGVKAGAPFEADAVMT